MASERSTHWATILGAILPMGDDFTGWDTVRHWNSKQDFMYNPWVSFEIHHETLQVKSEGFNSLWSGDVIWRQRTGLTLVQVMAYCLTAPSLYLNQILTSDAIGPMGIVVGHRAGRPSVRPERRSRSNSLRIIAISLKFGGIMHSTMEHIAI